MVKVIDFFKSQTQNYYNILVIDHIFGQKDPFVWSIRPLPMAIFWPTQKKMVKTTRQCQWLI